MVTCGATTGYEAKLDLRVLFASASYSFFGTWTWVARASCWEVLKHVFCGQAEAGS